MYLNVCGRVTVEGCLTFIPISCMGPKHAPKDQRFDFSTNLYAPEHVHLVQIWIMHINALKFQLMHKNVQRNLEKSQKLTHHSCCSMLTRENFESNKTQWTSFHPQRWDVPYRNHQACCEKLWFVRSIYPNLPKWDNKFTTACWCSSMIACQVS